MNDLSVLTRYLLNTVAEVIVQPIAKAGTDHAEIRAKLLEYRAGAATFATNAGVLGELHDAAVEHTRNRYLDWLDHPRLGHGPLIDEGEAADVSLRIKAAIFQESPTAANLLQLWLAIVRVAAITAVMGDTCIYSEAKRARVKKADGAPKRGPKGRARALRLSDVPDELWPLVERIGYGESGERAVALEELQELRGSALDASSIVTKLVQLARDPDAKLINQLATEIRRAGFVVQPATGRHAETVPVKVASTATKPSVAVDANHTPVKIVPVPDKAEAPSLPRTDGIDKDVAQKAEGLLIDFFTRQAWLLEERGDRIASNAGKGEIVKAFELVGYRDHVQARLRQIMTTKK
jgi:hypothetical protein